MKNILERSILLFILLSIVALAWMKPLDEVAEVQVDEGLKRALTSFAVARVLNGVISVAQGTEIAITPGGIGANLTPGQILDPVNDLVEQFSELMLLASISFGIMKISLSISSYWVFPAILTALALVWGGLTLGGRVPPLLLTKLLLVLIFVRFSVPVMTVGSDILYMQFLDKDFKENKLAIEDGKDQLISLNAEIETEAGLRMNAETTNSTAPSAEAAEKGMLEKISDEIKSATVKAKNLVASTVHKMNPKPYLERLKIQTNQLVEHIIKLMVIFVLQTIIIPLALLWSLYRLCLALIASAGKQQHGLHASPASI